MKPKVYVETSVISYLTARPSRDLIIAGHQQVTVDWWNSRRMAFELVASQLVVLEASAGDTEAAKVRLAVLSDIRLLEATEEARELARMFQGRGPLPQNATEDALHIAIAVTNGID